MFRKKNQGVNIKDLLEANRQLLEETRIKYGEVFQQHQAILDTHANIQRERDAAFDELKRVLDNHHQLIDQLQRELHP